MGDFLVLAWRPGSETATARARALGGRLAGAGWRSVAACTGASAWRLGGDLPVVASRRGRALLLGDLHAPVGVAVLPEGFVVDVLDEAPAAASRRLTGAGWGEYVAVFAGDEPQAYRDPSGALEAFAWTIAEGVWAVGSNVDRLPTGFLPRNLALEWSAIGRILRQPGRSSAESPLQGIAPLIAGRLTPLAQPEEGETVWSPAAVARRGGATDGLDAAFELERRIDGVVAAMVGSRGCVVAELSGGLDSAIVAASVHRAGLTARVADWINYYGGRPDGDERTYARAVAARLGLKLTEVPLEVAPVEAADFASLTRGVRPPMSALGRFHDRDMAERATQVQAGAILTGQGGDAALFQMPTPMVLTDALQGGGLAVLKSGLWGEVARWTGHSAWSALWAAVRAAKVVEPPPPMPGLSPAAGLGGHPWNADTEGLPPARRVQVAALAAGQLYPGDSTRRRAARILRPMFSQPVLEHVLTVPVPRLVEGGRDRALARRAYGARLPAAVIERRSKGGLGHYYGQVVLASLDWLGPHLLDGVLCDAGLLDRDVLAAALTPEALIAGVAPADILAAALMESWVRHWQGQAPSSAASPRTIFQSVR